MYWYGGVSLPLTVTDNILYWLICDLSQVYNLTWHKWNSLKITIYVYFDNQIEWCLNAWLKWKCNFWMLSNCIVSIILYRCQLWKWSWQRPATQVIWPGRDWQPAQLDLDGPKHDPPMRWQSNSRDGKRKIFPDIRFPPNLIDYDETHRVTGCCFLLGTSGVFLVGNRQPLCWLLFLFKNGLKKWRRKIQKFKSSKTKMIRVQLYSLWDSFLTKTNGFWLD